MLVLPFTGLWSVTSGSGITSLRKRLWSASRYVGTEQIPADFWLILGVFKTDPGRTPHTCIVDVTMTRISLSLMSLNWHTFSGDVTVIDPAAHLVGDVV